MDKPETRNHDRLTGGQRLLASLIWGGMKLMALLPLGILYGVSDFAAWLLYSVIGYRREMVASNMAKAFPEVSEEERRRWERRFYRYLCDVFVETAKLACVTDGEMGRRVKIEGVERVNDAIAVGRPVVLMLGHYGNWEWVTYAARHFIPGAVMCEIYHPLSNKVMDDVMLRLRSRFGTENIPMSRAVRRLVGIARSGNCFVCGFIADQRPFSSELKHWTDFLGLDTPYVNGGEVIGEKLGAEFIYVEMLPLRRGHYRMRFTPLRPLCVGEENPYTRAYLRELECSIRRNPPCWLWSHNRWKHRRRRPGDPES